MSEFPGFDMYKCGSDPGKFSEASRLEKACVEMESFFIHNLLKAMRATVPESGLLGKDGMSDRYISMLDGHLAVELAAGGGIGLARELAGQLAAAQGGYEDGLKSRGGAADKDNRHRDLHSPCELVQPGADPITGDDRHENNG